MVLRWRFVDPYDADPATNTYTVPINPNEMSSPFPQRQVAVLGSSAIDGQALFFEGNPKAAEWSFGGAILNASHYEALRSWVYNRPRRILIYDHFGREIQCILTKFTPTPKRSSRYWKHDYEISAYVIAVGAPTVELADRAF